MLTTSEESTEVGFFPVDTALDMITYGNFRQRIEMCLDEERQPFCVPH